MAITYAAILKSSYQVTGVIVSNGDVYYGDIRNRVPHGKGKCLYKNSETFEGEFVDGKKFRGTYLYKNSDTYCGHYLNDYKHGYGTYTWANGDSYEGNYDKDKMSGYGVFISGNNYKYSWDQVEATSFDQCDKYCGYWHDNKYSGFGVLTRSKHVCIGHFVKGKITGYAKYYSAITEKHYVGHWNVMCACFGVTRPEFVEISPETGDIINCIDSFDAFDSLEVMVDFEEFRCR